MSDNVGILIVSHGMMAEGIKDSVNLIMGAAEGIETSSLVAGQDFDSLKEDILLKVEKLNNGKGVLLFVDLFGASPHNASIFNYPELKEKNINIRVITGMNLPMILETSAMRSYSSLDELADTAIQSGKEGIVEAISIIENAVDVDEDDGDY